MTCLAILAHDETETTTLKGFRNHGVLIPFPKRVGNDRAPLTVRVDAMRLTIQRGALMYCWEPPPAQEIVLFIHHPQNWLTSTGRDRDTAVTVHFCGRDTHYTTERVRASRYVDDAYDQGMVWQSGIEEIGATHTIRIINVTAAYSRPVNKALENKTIVLIEPKT